MLHLDECQICTYLGDLHPPESDLPQILLTVQTSCQQSESQLVVSLQNVMLHQGLYLDN